LLLRFDNREGQSTSISKWTFRSNFDAVLDPLNPSHLSHYYLRELLEIKGSKFPA